MVAKADLLGREFGRLVVIGAAPTVGGGAQWLCRCTCGVEKVLPAARLVRGGCKSCGCLVVDTSRARALRDQIGGYKGYAKYKSVSDYLANTEAHGDCLLWKGPCYKNGYAKFPKNARIPTELGHRAVFFLGAGYLPEVVMHTCDTPQCINPQHLVAGTCATNSLDRVLKKRDLNTRKLTEDAVREIRAASAAGQSANSLGKQFSVSKQTVLSIIHRRIWSHIA